jgi:hypothetical protein
MRECKRLRVSEALLSSIGKEQGFEFNYEALPAGRGNGLKDAK